MGWGAGDGGQLDNSSTQNKSSPTQIPGSWLGAALGDTGTAQHVGGQCWAVKSDSTMWSWGSNSYGQLGQNDRTSVSSPIQIPGTTWAVDTEKFAMGFVAAAAIKTNGTLWSWGYNTFGGLGQNNRTHYSSPVQIPGSTWTHVSGSRGSYVTAIKTDGTLWVWGKNNYGVMGQNEAYSGPAKGRSSPTQIPGTTWSSASAAPSQVNAIKTDGTLWTWGDNENSGQLGINDVNDRSSPTQVPGTTWNYISAGRRNFFATQQL